MAETPSPRPADLPDSVPVIPPDAPLWRKLLRWLPVAVLVLAGLIAVIFGLGKYFSLSEIIKGREWLEDYVSDGPILAGLIYAVAYVVAVVLSIPGGSLLTILGGALFGGVIGGLLTTVAATAASLIVFLVARTALGDWMVRRVQAFGPRIARIASRLRHHAFVVIVLLRLVPVMPYWASNVVPAIFGVSIGTYTLATLVGLLPWTVSFAFFGVALDEVVAAQELANPGCSAAGTCEVTVSALWSGEVITGIAIAIAAIIPVLWLSYRQKRQEQAAEAETTPPSKV